MGEMREGAKRGPLVEEDMFVLPVVAAGDCHIVWIGGRGRWVRVVSGELVTRQLSFNDCGCRCFVESCQLCALELSARGSS